MVLLLRAVARLVTFLLLVALAAAGLATAIFSLGGSGDWSIPGLANLVGLPDTEDDAGRLLEAVEAEGSIAWLSGLAGLGALALGVLLLIGALAPARERLLVHVRNDDGTLAARRRALAQVAGALVEQVRGVTATKVRLRPSRRDRGGRLSVRAAHSATADPDEIKRHAAVSVAPLTEGFGLKLRVRPGLGGPGKRVQ